MALSFRRFGTAQLRLGEGPVWDERRGLLFCVDIPAATVHAFRLDGSAAGHWQMPDAFAASLGLCRSGRLLVALERSLVMLDPETGAITSFATVPQESAEGRLNDGKVGPDGAFWVGSMDRRPERAPIGSLYRVTPDGAVKQVIGPSLRVSNGLAWSPDGQSLFHADSSARWIARWNFDAATGAITNRHVIVPDITNEQGRPDGAAMLANGDYLSAGVSGGVLNRWSPEGHLIERLPVPAPAPTMPCFCGSDLKTLVVTTLQPGPERPAHPLSGALFVAETPFAGAPVPRFAD